MPFSSLARPSPTPTHGATTMSLITHCLDCGTDSPVIGRFAGFFGLVEIHSPYCLACITEHADDLGHSPYDAIASLVAAASSCPSLH